MLPPGLEPYRFLKERGNDYLQNYKRYFHRPHSSAITHTPSQLEDGNLKLQEEIASNVCQFNENEKKAEGLLDMLDEVGMSLLFYFPSSPNAQVLREWERLPADDMSQWAREMIQQRSMSDKSTIF